MARFDDVYYRPDPRATLTRPAPPEYEIPHHAQPVFRQAAAERSALDDGRSTDRRSWRCAVRDQRRTAQQHADRRRQRARTQRIGADKRNGSRGDDRRADLPLSPHVYLGSVQSASRGHLWRRKRLHCLVPDIRIQNRKSANMAEILATVAMKIVVALAEAIILRLVWQLWSAYAPTLRRAFAPAAA
ncbi:hypothetical protein [Streptomyces sp. NPDC054783]